MAAFRSSVAGRILVGLLALVLALVLALLIAAPAQSSPPPVTVRLNQLGPDVVRPGSTVQASITVTNNGATPITNPVLEMHVSSSRVTDRAMLAEWSRRTPDEPLGRLVASTGLNASGVSAPSAATIAPGANATLTVSAPADSLQLSSEMALWGPRRVALVVRDGASNPVAVVRTFMIWVPSADAAPPGAVDYSVLVPIAAQDPAASVATPQAFNASATSGRLQHIVQIAKRVGVDWWLDPSLLSPPPATPATEEKSTQQPKPQPTPPSGGTAPPSTNPEENSGAKPSDSATPAPTASANPQPPSASQPAQSAPSDGASGNPSAPSASPTPSPTATSTPPTDDETKAKTPAHIIAQTLREHASDHTVLAMPYARTDIASVARAGAHDVRTAALDKTKETLTAAGIDSAGIAVGLAPESASVSSARQESSAGAQILLAPSATVLRKPDAEYLPSMVGRLSSGDKTANETGPIVIAPDSTLSEQFGNLASTVPDDAAILSQRMLAETAVLAGARDGKPAAHIVIALPTDTDPNPATVNALLNRLTGTQWARSKPLSTLLDQAGSTEKTAAHDNGATVPQNTSAPGLGPVTELHAAVSHDGEWDIAQHSDEPAYLPPAVVESVNDQWTRLGNLASALEKPEVLDGLRLEAFAAVSTPLRGHPKETAQAGGALASQVNATLSKVQVVAASSYNLVSSSAGIPVTISNDLPSAVSVRPQLSPDRPLIRIGEDVPLAKIPAHGRGTVTVPVEAIANGKVTLTVQLLTAKGTPISATGGTPLSVNANWENATTLIVVVAMGLLVVVGVLRARHTGSDKRVPGEVGPEPPLPGLEEERAADQERIQHRSDGKHSADS